jgi:hypothetical protein
MLVHHADSGAHCVAGASETLNDIVEENVALFGLVETVKNVHERGLTGSVLTEETVNLSGLDDQIDVIVGDERSESLRDAAKFELHG